MNLLKEIAEIKSTRKEIREFAWVVGGVLLLIVGIAYWRHRVFHEILCSIGIGLIFFGVTFPMVLKPLQKGWMILALLIGWVMTRVILSLLFYTVLTPIGLLMKITNKDLLKQKLEPAKSSYWHYRETQDWPDKKVYENQF